MVKGWKTHLNKEDRDGKRAILIDGWKTHTKRKKNRVRKHTILIFDCWKAYSNQERDRVGKHSICANEKPASALREVKVVRAQRHTQKR